MSGHVFPTRQFGGFGEEDISATLQARDYKGVPGALCVEKDKAFRMVAFGEYADDETASTAKARDYKDATDLVISVLRHVTPKTSENIAGTILARDYKDPQAVCYPIHDPAPTISAAHHHAVATKSVVRRLSPTECERLQGFPDSYTKIPYRNKTAEQCPDGPRYKALGNSMAVPVMRWIGERIQQVEAIK